MSSEAADAGDWQPEEQLEEQPQIRINTGSADGPHFENVHSYFMRQLRRAEEDEEEQDYELLDRRRHRLVECLNFMEALRLSPRGAQPEQPAHSGRGHRGVVRPYSNVDEYFAETQRRHEQEQRREREREEERMQKFLNEKSERDKLPLDTPLPVYLSYRQQQPPQLPTVLRPLAQPKPNEHDEDDVVWESEILAQL